jgi:hypothetical protein
MAVNAKLSSRTPGSLYMVGAVGWQWCRGSCSRVTRANPRYSEAEVLAPRRLIFPWPYSKDAIGQTQDQLWQATADRAARPARLPERVLYPRNSGLLAPRISNRNT